MSDSGLRVGIYANNYAKTLSRLNSLEGALRSALPFTFTVTSEAEVQTFGGPRFKGMKSVEMTVIPTSISLGDAAQALRDKSFFEGYQKLEG